MCVTSIGEREAGRNEGTLGDRLLQSTVHALELASVYLGKELGLYEVLAWAAPMTSAELATSAATAMTRAALAAPMLLAAASSASRPRATIATSAPDCAKRVATPNPIPLLPPVTMAVFPSSDATRAA